MPYKGNLLLGGLLAAVGAAPITAAAHEDGDDKSVGAGLHAALEHLATRHKLTLGGGLTIIGQGKRGNTDESGLTYSVDLVFDGDFEENGKAFLYIDTSEGRSVSTGSLIGPNADD